MIDYSNILSRVANEIKPSGIRRFFDLANSIDGVISLGVGEPDFRTPWQIRSAGIRSLERANTRYTSNRGLDELREQISLFTKGRLGIEYDPKTEILVTVGGSEAIDAAIRAIVDPGDEVIIPQPSFVCYEPIVRLAGGVPVIIETLQENNFKLTAVQLENAITEKTKAIILPYPSNPTGAVMRREDLNRIAEVVKRSRAVIISDEIYSELTFGNEKHVSIAAIDEMKERTVVINGFSKAFSMTGWRLGYAMGPGPIMATITKIHQYAIMCAPTTSQFAAIEALRSCDGAVKEMMEEYDLRRRFTVTRFNEIGLLCNEPEGAFYAFPSVKSTGLSSDEFCERLLMEEKVALVPGGAFGLGGEGFVRASYCYSMGHLKEAMLRIERFVRKIREK